MGIFTGRTSYNGHQPMVGLTKIPPVTPFKFEAGKVAPKQLPGNGQR